MTKLEIGLLYLSLHCQLCNLTDGAGEITRKEFFRKLGQHFLIPKNLRPVVIREMEKMGLIKRKNRDVIIILDKKIDLERDVNKLYKLAGLF